MVLGVLVATSLLCEAIEFNDSGQRLGDGISSDVALGDVDRDGDLDALVAAYGVSNKLWINQGGMQGGTLGAFTDSGQALGDGAGVAVVLADVDGDQDLDVVSLEDDVTSTIQIWLNQGGAQGGTEGVFASNGQSIGGSLNSGLDVAELDSIAGPDLFVARTLGRTDTAWFNDGSGSFTDSGQALGAFSSIDVRLGDLDGDGDQDAFVVYGDVGRVWMNQGGGQGGTAGLFQDSGQLLNGQFMLSVDLGDVDGDGDLDAVTGDSAGDRVWINQGGAQGAAEGVFADSGQALGPPGAQGRGVQLGDLDGDDDLDVFALKGGVGVVYVNDGDGGFTDVGLSLGEAANTAEGVALGDVDGDGDLDAFVANYNGPDLVWLNESAPTTYGFFARSDQSLRAGDDRDDWEVLDAKVLDVDGDSKLDVLLLVTNFFNGTSDLEVWINAGDGGPGEANTHSRAAVVELPDSIEGMEAGDVDNDGDQDLLLLADGGGNRLLLNAGGGSLVDSGQVLGEVAVLDRSFGSLADVDGDNDLDVLVMVSSDIFDAELAIYLNQGGPQGGTVGVFTDSGMRFGPDPGALSMGDVDGDGDLDAVAIAEVGGFITTEPNLYLNQGGAQGGMAGEFLACSGPNCLEGVTGSASELADLDGDGDLDLVVARFFVVEHDEATEHFGHGVFINQGGDQGGTEGEFVDSGQNLRAAEERPDRAEVGDLDGDGDLDLLVSRRGDCTEIWMNDGRAAFTFAAAWGSSFYLDQPTSIIAKLDNDPVADVLLGRDFWLNRGAEEETSLHVGVPLARSRTGVNFLSWWKTGNATVGLQLNRPHSEVVSVDVEIKARVPKGFEECNFQSPLEPSICWREDLRYPAGETERPLTSGWIDRTMGQFRTGGAESEVWNPFQGDIPSPGAEWEVLVRLSPTSNVVLRSPPTFHIYFHNDVSLVRNCLLEGIGQLLGIDEPPPPNGAARGPGDENGDPLYRSLLRGFRACVLGVSPEGRYFADLYHRWSGEVLQLVTEDPALADEFLEALNLWMPGTRALLDGTGDSVVVTQDMHEALTTLLETIKDRAGPELQAAILAEEAHFDIPALVGQSMDDLVKRMSARTLSTRFERFAAALQPGNLLRITAEHTTPSLRYQLRRSFDLIGFEDEGAPQVGTGGDLHWFITPGPQPSSFFDVAQPDYGN